MSLANEVLRWSNNVLGWSHSQFMSLHPGQSLPCWTSSCWVDSMPVRDHRSCNQELIVQMLSVELKKKINHLLKSCLPCDFPTFLLMLREEFWHEEQWGCAQRNRHESFIFHCQLQGKKIFFYNLHEGFFLNKKLCTHGYKPKCTVIQRKGAKKTSPPFPHLYHSSVHPETISNVSLL